MLVMLAVGATVFSALFLIPLFLYVMPYHTLHQNAVAFDAAPSCREGFEAPAAAPTAATPCTVEQANVLRDYATSSHASRSRIGYRYYLDLRGSSLDLRTVELADESVWQRAKSGDAIKLQLWGERPTAVQLGSGETSPTTQNPDWQLANDVSGLRLLLILWLFVVAADVALIMVLRASAQLVPGTVAQAIAVIKAARERER